MTEKEPIEEVSSLWNLLVRGLKSFFKDKSHRDLKRSYGKECALVLLKEVPHPDLYFRLHNGVKLKGLCDLAEVLPEMDDATFHKHVSAGKNEFSDWVRNVIGDKTLANKLDLLDNREDVARAVNVRVNWFKNRVG
jgi:DMSO/TMAO reductase YedYZ molybdopterin-dependent catalytic subunit